MHLLVFCICRSHMSVLIILWICNFQYASNLYLLLKCIRPFPEFRQKFHICLKFSDIFGPIWLQFIKSKSLCNWNYSLEWRLEFEIFFAKVLLNLNLPTGGDILSYEGMEMEDHRFYRYSSPECLKYLLCKQNLLFNKLTSSSTCDTHDTGE